MLPHKNSLVLLNIFFFLFLLAIIFFNISNLYTVLFSFVTHCVILYFQLEVFLKFFLRLDLPFSVIQGEQIIILANVFNYYNEDLEVSHILFIKLVVVKQFSLSQFLFLWQHFIQVLGVIKWYTQSLLKNTVATKGWRFSTEMVQFSCTVCEQ